MTKRHTVDIQTIRNNFGNINKGRFQTCDYLGKGAYGVVISAFDKVIQDEVAIKVVRSEILRKPYLANRVLREIAIMAHFSHPNIIGIQNLILSNESHVQVGIVMDLMDMDLSALLKSGQSITEIHVKYFVAQILSALDHIHSAGVIHRDLTPSNCLIDLKCDLKICDFGLARELDIEMTDYVVMRWYRAPELLMGLPNYDHTVDIWSCGCIMAQMLNNGQAMFVGTSSLRQLECILEKLGHPSDKDLKEMGIDVLSSKWPFYVRKNGNWSDNLKTPEGHNISNEAINLLQHMMTFVPSHRYTANEALHHKYLEEYLADSIYPKAKPFHHNLPDITSLDYQRVMKELLKLQKLHGWDCIPEIDESNCVDQVSSPLSPDTDVKIDLNFSISSP